MVVSIADPCVVKIPVKECNDPLVDLRRHSKIAFGPPPERPDNTCYTKMRSQVYDKLCRAQKMLPAGIHLCLYEGWRSLELQNELFQAMYHKNHEQFPHFGHEELFVETTKLVSPVILLDQTRNIPPHATGGAVDVYLIDSQGKPLDMGLLIEEWMFDIGAHLSQTLSSRINKEARENRELMSHVLSQVGFINYPNEYWHWSYGDRYWAFCTNADHAIYDCIS